MGPKLQLQQYQIVPSEGWVAEDVVQQGLFAYWLGTGSLSIKDTFKELEGLEGSIVSLAGI